MRDGRRTALFIAVALGIAIFVVAGWFLSLHLSPIFAELPAVTTASDDHGGDPVNIAFVGDENSITKVFLAAHWLVPDPINASSTARIVKASAVNAPYPTAPISDLELFGRPQDLAFELPTHTVRSGRIPRQFR